MPGAVDRPSPDAAPPLAGPPPPVRSHQDSQRQRRLRQRRHIASTAAKSHGSAIAQRDTQRIRSARSPWRRPGQRDGSARPGSCVSAPLVPGPSPARPPWLSAIGQRGVSSITQRCCHVERSAHRDCSAQSASRYAAVPAAQHDSPRPRPSRLERGSIPRRVDPGARRVHPVVHP